MKCLNSVRYIYIILFTLHLSLLGIFIIFNVIKLLIKILFFFSRRKRIWNIIIGLAFGEDSVENEP